MELSMKIISRNVNEVVPDFKESDYFKSIVLSIVTFSSPNEHTISYIVWIGNEFYLTGIGQKNYRKFQQELINHLKTKLEAQHDSH